MRVLDRRERKQKKREEFMKRLAERDARNRGVVLPSEPRTKTPEEKKVDVQPAPIIEVSAPPVVMQEKAEPIVVVNESVPDVVISTPLIVKASPDTDDNVQEEQEEAKEEVSVSNEEIEAPVLSPKKRGKKKKS